MKESFTMSVIMTDAPNLNSLANLQLADFDLDPHNVMESSKREKINELGKERLLKSINDFLEGFGMVAHLDGSVLQRHPKSEDFSQYPELTKEDIEELKDMVSFMDYNDIIESYL